MRVHSNRPTAPSLVDPHILGGEKYGRVIRFRVCSVIPIIYGLDGIGKNLEEL
jgi:hypothetical protein